MSCVKDKHPYNLWFCLAWSVVLGLFLGAADLPGAYARAHSFFIIMLELTGGVLFLTFFSQLKTRNAEGEVKLWSFGSAGMCSWLLLTIPIAVIAFTQAKDSVDWGIPAGTRSEEDPGEVNRQALPDEMPNTQLNPGSDQHLVAQHGVGATDDP